MTIGELRRITADDHGERRVVMLTNRGEVIELAAIDYDDLDPDDPVRVEDKVTPFDIILGEEDS